MAIAIATDNFTERQQATKQRFMIHNQTINPDPLHVDLKTLIQLRYQSSGMDFSASLSRNKRTFSALSGGHLSPFKGRGLDFDEVRPYQPGDDIRSIDWNVTARTHRVHSKVFKEEREKPVFIVVDYNPTMHFATRGMLKSVMAAHLAALSGWIAADNYYHIGGLVFYQQYFSQLRPASGYRGVLKLLRILQQQHQPWEMSQNRPERFSAEVLIHKLRKAIRPGTLIILISDFSFVNSHNIALFANLSRHNDMICHFVYDPLEAELPPPGRYALAASRDTGNTPQQFFQIDTASAAYRQHYRQKFIHKDAFLEQHFQKMGIHFNRIATNEPAPKNMQAFLGHHGMQKRMSKSRSKSSRKRER